MAVLPLACSVTFTDGVTTGKDVDGRPIFSNEGSYPLIGKLGFRHIGLMLGFRHYMVWQPHYYDGSVVSMDVDGETITDPRLVERQRARFFRGAWPGNAPWAMGIRRFMLATPKYYNGTTLGKDQDGTLQPDPIPGTYRVASVARCKSGFFSFVTKHLLLPGLFKTIPDSILTDPKQ